MKKAIFITGAMVVAVGFGFLADWIGTSLHPKPGKAIETEVWEVAVPLQSNDPRVPPIPPTYRDSTEIEKLIEDSKAARAALDETRVKLEDALAELEKSDRPCTFHEWSAERQNEWHGKDNVILETLPGFPMGDNVP